MTQPAADTTTLDEALHMARTVRGRLGPMDWALLDDVATLVIWHPSIDVLDAFCAGITPMQTMADGDLVVALHALSRDVDIAARDWTGPSELAA